MPFDENQFNHPVTPACNTCKHYKAFSNPPACAAFPNGIPRPIFQGKDQHRKPYRGDNGIQYEKED